LQSKLSKGQWDIAVIMAMVLLAFSVVFGGASRDHVLRLAIVELASLPLLVVAAGRLLAEGRWREHRTALLILAAITAIPLLQLVPLPPSVWTALPGRSEPALALELAGLQPGWVPLSLRPDFTWRSALALLPPAAMFLALLTFRVGDTVRLVHLYLIAALGGVLLGGAQLISGGEALYPWATTSAGSVTGFFANRNHLATFLLASLPFATVIGAGALRRGGGELTRLWLAALFIGLIIVGLAAIRSRAGMVLLVPALSASLLAAWVAAGRGRPKPALLAMVGAAAAALTAVAVLALPPILARFDTASSPEGRFERWPLVADAAQAYLPVGSGIGTFDAVFRSVEPLEQLDPTFFNHAHNEYLEAWMETGWLGIFVIVAMLLWYARRTRSAWKAGPSTERDLQRAASIAVGVVLLHSIGDYPLRTAAMAVFFGFLCAVLELAGRSREKSGKAADPAAA
jgi:O-antigen ligase